MLGKCSFCGAVIRSTRCPAEGSLLLLGAVQLSAMATISNNGHAALGDGAARQPDDGEYNRHSMLGSLMEEYDDDADLPLLYFHSVPEAWVSFLLCHHWPD